MSVDLTKISGAKKKVWWYSPKDGKLSFIGEFDSKITPFLYDGSYNRDNDQVLIAVDSNKNYISTKWFELPMVNQQCFEEYSQKVLLSLNETGKVNAEIVILKKHIYK